MKLFAFVLHEMQVVADEHDAIARGDAGHGDEADERGDADVVQLEVGEDQPADERERDVARAPATAKNGVRK